MTKSNVLAQKQIENISIFALRKAYYELRDQYKKALRQVDALTEGKEKIIAQQLEIKQTALHNQLKSFRKTQKRREAIYKRKLLEAKEKYTSRRSTIPKISRSVAQILPFSQIAFLLLQLSILLDMPISALALILWLGERETFTINDVKEHLRVEDNEVYNSKLYWLEKSGYIQVVNKGAVNIWAFTPLATEIYKRMKKFIKNSATAIKEQ